MEWFLKALKQYADFKGRARRMEYWMFVLFTIIGVFVLVILGGALESVLGGEGYAVIPLVLYVLAMIIPWLAVCVRRLHDQGKSGTYYFVRFIPLVGGIWFLVLMCTDSESGDNKWGANPKNPSNNELNEIGVSEA